MCKALTSPPSPHRHGDRPQMGRSRLTPASTSAASARLPTLSLAVTGLEANCLGATAEDREAALPPPTITRFVPQPTDPPPFPPPFYRGAPGQGRQRLRGHGWCDLPGSGRRAGKGRRRRETSTVALIWKPTRTWNRNREARSHDLHTPCMPGVWSHLSSSDNLKRQGSLLATTNFSQVNKAYIPKMGRGISLKFQYI